MVHGDFRDRYTPFVEKMSWQTKSAAIALSVVLVTAFIGEWWPVVVGWLK
jgi:hypothetical protein